MQQDLVVCPLLATLQKAAQQLGADDEIAKLALQVLQSNRIKALSHLKDVSYTALKLPEPCLKNVRKCLKLALASTIDGKCK